MAVCVQWCARRLVSLFSPVCDWIISLTKLQFSSVISSLTAGWFADRIGRRYTLLSGFLLSFIGITLEVVAVTNDLFFIGKSVNGLAIGVLISVGMTYVGEVSSQATSPLRCLHFID
jgi:MFS family permease